MKLESFDIFPKERRGPTSLFVIFVTLRLARVKRDREVCD